MAEKEYIEREAFVEAIMNQRLYYTFGDPNSNQGAYNMVKRVTLLDAVRRIPAADVRPVTVCTNCEHNNHCLTQEFVDDCGKITLDRNTFFCADGERRSNA